MRRLTLLLLMVGTVAWTSNPGQNTGGRSGMAEVIRLTELEMGPQPFDFVGYFTFLEKHGYVEFVRE